MGSLEPYILRQVTDDETTTTTTTTTSGGGVRCSENVAGPAILDPDKLPPYIKEVSELPLLFLLLLLLLSPQPPPSPLTAPPPYPLLLSARRLPRILHGSHINA